MTTVEPLLPSDSEQGRCSRRAAPEIRKLDRAQLSNAVASAARAFHDDVMFNYFEPDLCKQLMQLPRFMRAHLLDTLPFGETYAAYVDGKAKAVAGWHPPGAYPLSFWRDLKYHIHILPSFLAVGRRLLAGLQLLAMAEKVHPKIPRWNLDLMAVDPSLQGQGIGTALLQPVLERCDREGMAAYVETQKWSNVEWYGRFGFEVVHELRVPGAPGMPPY